MTEDAPDKRCGPGVLSSSVLVLNRFYTPINVISVRRAFVLLYKDTAEAIDGPDGAIQGYRIGDWIKVSQDRLRRLTDHEEFVRTPRYAIMVPRIIRLINCASLPKHEVKFTKRNVLVRDGHRCQYCGKKFPASRLTVDHIIPRSRGGRSIWTNVVTACMDCNTRKGGKLPWEVGMKLIRPPTVPRKNPVIVDRLNNERYRIWINFVKDTGE